MEGFLIELRRVIGQWPERARWTVAQLASYTGSQAADLTTWLSFALKREMDLTDPLTLEEGEKALDRLTEAHEKGVYLRPVASGEEDASGKYQKIIARSRQLGMEGDWRRAYKNLSSFLATHSQRLPFDVRLEAIGECLRIGIKADETSAELFLWLKRGIKEATQDGTLQGTEEALDFIDAYGEPFVEEGRSSAIDALIESLQDLVTKHSLQEKLDGIREDIGLIRS